MSLQIQLHVPAFIRCLGTLMIPGFCNKSESDCAVHRTQLTVSVSFLYRNTNHNNNDCSSHRLLHYKVGQVQRECVCVWLRRKTLSLSFSSTRMKKVKTALHVNIHVRTHTARSLNVSESRLFSRTTYLFVSSGASLMSITLYGLHHCLTAATPECSSRRKKKWSITLVL